MSKTLFVGNLSFDLSDEDLEQAFAEFGTVTSARIIRDRETRRSKGFGFVEFEDDAAADAAVAKMDGKDLNGRPLRVNEARPREDAA